MNVRPPGRFDRRRPEQGLRINHRIRVPEVRVVQTVRYDAPLAQEQRSFEFVLPAAPYSYAGALATLSWAIELVAIPEKEFVRVLFKLGPHADVVELFGQLE